MLGLTLKSKLIEAGIIKEYEDNRFWFTKALCIVFWISTLVGGPIVSLLTIFINLTTGFFQTFLAILEFSIAAWQMISFIIFLVNFIKWKNIFGPWDF